ncbi:hypothetical protein FPV60_14955 [Acinetobacter colistiniresistens]|uniref:Uncharacterized protein n=1 Tax=Acinetobacter colistiniresistens TaxID=280145 RepID=A0A558F0I8_9GAMM|nr:hypothetical protein FPV60_14955 [Acinetobacter colistiniresistens]
MNKIEQNNSLLSQTWSFMCSEGLPCLFVILMLCNGLFFAYALFDTNHSDTYKVSSQHTINQTVSKNNYIN